MQRTRCTIRKEHWHEIARKTVDISHESKYTKMLNYRRKVVVKIYPFSTSHESKVIMESTRKTDRTLPNNKPDIISRDNGKETCLIKDTGIS